MMSYYAKKLALREPKILGSLMASTLFQLWLGDKEGVSVSVAVCLQVLQSLVVLAFAPLYVGVIARAESIIASKRGPSIFQPYWDLAKLLRKGETRSDQVSFVYLAAPFAVMSCYLTVSVIVPIITNNPLPLAFLADLIGGAFVLTLAGFITALAGLDTASPHGGLGASRATWIGSLVEPALIIIFFTVGVLSSSDNPYLMNHILATSGYAWVLPTHLLGMVAFFMIILVENGRIPIESPNGSIEISMIEEGRVLEYSGRRYALMRWASWMKFFLMSAIFMNVFVIPWGLGNATTIVGGLVAIPVLLAKLCLCGFAVVVIDTSFAKLRFFRIAEFLGAALLLALVGVVTSYVIGT
ncbi:MAG: NADH-quinone oxidoreductase subunit H [Acidimicrobiales bacterium]